MLVVDDHAGFRALARLLLEEGGFVVVGEVEDGASALVAARELTPDVVLVDYGLPDLDGFAVAARLSSNGGPQVVVTSSRDASDLTPLVGGSGACGFIPKAELCGETLATVLDGEPGRVALSGGALLP